MGQRKMMCTSQMIDLEMDQEGQSYLHPDPCILLGGRTSFQQPDIQSMVTSGNATNFDVHPLPQCYDGSLFGGMPPYHGVPHHPNLHGPNLDLGAAASNFYMPYIASPAGVTVSHGSSDQLPSSSNYGMIGVSADEYGTSSHFMDSARGSYKRKNVDVNPMNSQSNNSSASSSSSVSPLNARHPDGVPMMDNAPPPFRGNNAPSVREVGPQRSVRNRLGSSGLDPVLAHNQNHFIQGNYLGQHFQLGQQMSNCTNDAGEAWTRSPPIPWNNVNGSTIDSGNMGPQWYHEPISNRNNNSGFLHHPHINLRCHNFHLSPPVQGMRGHNVNILRQAPTASFRVPTTDASQRNLNPSHDSLDTGTRHLGSVQPTGLRMFRAHHEGVVPETTLRHRGLPHLRVVPNDGVAVLEFPDYYEMENYTDHHRDMRLDIEDMSYEELLALGERIGSVNTGLSDEVIRCKLETRSYLSYPNSINLEEVACVDQEPDSCIICQEDYKNLDKIANLACGHEYHEDCLKQWLRIKNVCPICKCEALSTDRKGV